jgi:hypothetical protein
VLREAGAARAGARLIERGLAGLEDSASCKALVDTMGQALASADLLYD